MAVRLLIELRSEEIPARMQPAARVELERLFRARVDAAGLAVEGVTTHSTPRRLALIAEAADATQAGAEERKGPRADAPDKAIDGFLRSTGLTRDQLEEREVKGQAVLFAVTQTSARPAADVIVEAVPAMVREFSWPKSMRWGAASLSTESPRWVRPLQGLVVLLDGEVVPCEVAGIAAGRETLGHRVHAPGPLSIDGADSYVAQLRAAHVLVDPDERRRVIADGAARLVDDAGLALVADEGLLTENVGLTEWPVPLLGRFDAESLTLPPEVIQLTARVNQKYFVAHDGDGALANAFVCAANLDASDGGAAIVAGNERVLAARLSDARFFWNADLAVPLEEQAAKLDRIVFHEKLGTVADKVDRVAKLARWLVEEGAVKGADPDLTERAARLCKADLVTSTVTEFPELQGLAGGHLALAQGEDPQVAAAIRDHYKPVGPDDEVPTAPVTVAVSLADKLDTLTGFFALNEKPTGSKDPFALRRAVLALAATVSANKLRASLNKLVLSSYEDHALGYRAHDVTESRTADKNRVANEILSFAIDRLKVQQREAGIRHDLIDAVFALGGEDDLVRLIDRTAALQAFVETDEGADLLAGYKRAVNILKKEGVALDASSPADAESHSDPSAPLDPRVRGDDGVGGDTSDDPALGRHPAPQGVEQTGEEDPLAVVGDDSFDNAVAAAAPDDPGSTAEEVLTAALKTADVRVTQAVDKEEWENAMSALASLRDPIDRFFEHATVNDPDPATRERRLQLLVAARNIMHRVADFSQIEG